MKITDLHFEPHPAELGGMRATVRFPNGFGASIITGPLFYSHPNCPYEIAVLDKDDRITYTTPITEDVCGYLTEQEANDILAQIKALPATSIPTDEATQQEEAANG